MKAVIAILATIATVACSKSPVANSSPDELSFGEASFGQIVARTQYFGRAGSILRFEVEFRNAGPILEEFSVSFSCPMLLLVFSEQDRTGDPLWDARRDGGECPADAITITLAPGGLYRVPWGIDSRWLAQHGLGGRHVAFSGIVRVRGAERAIPAGNGVIQRD